MNRRGVQRGYNNSYYPNDPAPYYYEEDDPNDDEEHARQYTLELDWLASVREGEKVDLKTQEYEWTRARVHRTHPRARGRARRRARMDGHTHAGTRRDGSGQDRKANGI